MIEQLTQLDHQIFFAINNGLSNAFFDFLMPILRNKLTWIPLYALIVFFAIKWYKLKGLYLLLFLGATVGMADYGSASILKPSFERIRPCNNELIKERVISRVPCGSGLSFPSTHASDHFAIAIFFITIFYRRWKPVIPIGLIWAGSICLAQVYVGVHFPADVTVGMLFGSLLAFFVASVFKRYIVLPDTI